MCNNRQVSRYSTLVEARKENGVSENRGKVRGGKIQQEVANSFLWALGVVVVRCVGQPCALRPLPSCAPVPVSSPPCATHNSVGRQTHTHKLRKIIRS